jgi:hypothetical protein
VGVFGSITGALHLIFYIIAGLLNSSGRFLRLFLGAFRKTISFTYGYVSVFPVFRFTKVAKPVPESIDQSVFRTIYCIDGYRKAGKHKSEDEKRSHEFTHDTVPSPSLDF